MNTFTRYLTALLLTACAAAASAGTIGLHTYSHHTSDTYERTEYRQVNGRFADGARYLQKYSVTTHREYNNQNFGMYYIADNGFTIGGYRNSYDKNTVYAGYTVNSDRYLGGYVSGSVSVALATGYRELASVGVLRPVVLPALRLHLGDAAIRLSGFPAGSKSFMHLSAEVGF